MNMSPNKKKFYAALAKLINEYCIENGSNTPDYLLTEYLMGCLEAYEKAVRARDTWFGVGRDVAARAPRGPT